MINFTNQLQGCNQQNSWGRGAGTEKGKKKLNFILKCSENHLVPHRPDTMFLGCLKNIHGIHFDSLDSCVYERASADPLSICHLMLLLQFWGDLSQGYQV